MGVVKASVNGATVLKDQTPNSSIVTGVKGWKVKGEDIGTYKIRADDAEKIGIDGYILLYDNTAATYLYHTGANGNYTLPYRFTAPPEDPSMIGFKGWKLLGWEVISTPGRNVAQSYTVPTGTDGYIVHNGTIKFTYVNNPQNGEAQA